MSLAARALGEMDRAQVHFAKAVTNLHGRDFFGLLDVFSVAALLKADMGDLVRAVELDALLQTYPVIANSRWWWDVARRHVAQLAESLPAEETARAEEWGRSQDLNAVAAELLAELG